MGVIKKLVVCGGLGTLTTLAVALAPSVVGGSSRLVDDVVVHPGHDAISGPLHDCTVTVTIRRALLWDDVNIVANSGGWSAYGWPYPCFGGPPREVDENENPIPAHVDPHAIEVLRDHAGSWTTLTSVRSGFPLRCMGGGDVVTNSGPWGERAVLSSFVTISWIGESEGDRKVVLPGKMLIGGFAGNTGVFGSLWFGLIFAPGATRRAWRRHRGRCPRCAYDLRHDLTAGCPECGWGREERE